MFQIVNPELFQTLNADAQGVKKFYPYDKALLEGTDITKVSPFTLVVAANSDCSFERINENNIGLYTEDVDGKIRCRIVSSPKNTREREIILAAIPFNGFIDPIVEPKGYKIYKVALCDPKKGYHINFNDRNYSKVLYVIIEIEPELIMSGDNYLVEIPFVYYSTCRKVEGEEQKWNKDEFTIVAKRDSIELTFDHQIVDSFSIDSLAGKRFKVTQPVKKDNRAGSGLSKSHQNKASGSKGEKSKQVLKTYLKGKGMSI